MQDFSTLPITIIAILVALTVHECAHAYVAFRLGDDTAKHLGRITFNPFAHLDPIGALVFIVAGFGWAKPVPISPRNFRHPVRDSAIVAAAGPLSNLILAFTFAVLTRFVPFDAVLQQGGLDSGDAAWALVSLFVRYSIRLNLALMAFNLLPIPPLDGSNILRHFVPWRYREQYDQYLSYGMWAIIAVLLVESFLGLSIVGAWVGAVTDLVLAVFARFFGLFGL